MNVQDIFEQFLKSLTLTHLVLFSGHVSGNAHSFTLQKEQLSYLK